MLSLVADMASNVRWLFEEKLDADKVYPAYAEHIERLGCN